ncbi:MAG: hypothetical protein ACOC22_02915 [bacterium]
MSKEHTIALKVIKEKIKNNKSFSFDELQDEIIERGGILRISPGYSVGEYVIGLEEDGIIEFDPDSKKFKILEQI